MKVIMWGVMAFGLYLAVLALIHGDIGWALLIIFILIPVALWLGSMILGLVSMVALYPLAFLLGRRREYTEVTNFAVAVADAIGAERMNLRATWTVMNMYNELPKRERGQPTRSGAELVELYEEHHPYDEWEMDEAPT